MPKLLFLSFYVRVLLCFRIRNASHIATHLVVAIVVVVGGGGGSGKDVIAGRRC